MISTKSRLAVALGVVGAIALSMSVAEARTKQRQTKAQANVQNSVSGVSVQPSFGRAFNYEPGFAGGGINFRDGRGGANYNPNQ